MSWEPWNDYVGLTPDRLVAVADLIRSAREGAADDHRPEMGEGNWSLGVRCYERSCRALRWATEMYNWLSVVAGAEGGPVHFVMTIGGHAVRFYRGSPESAPGRYRQASFPELAEQQQLALELDGDLPAGRALRIAIENDESGRPESISLVEISNDTGNTLHKFLIPPLSQGTVAPFGAPADSPVSILPVSAEPLDSAKAGSGDE